MIFTKFDMNIEAAPALYVLTSCN